MQAKSSTRVKRISSSSATSTCKPDDPFTEVYVKNLINYYKTEDKVRQLFKPFGKVTNVRIIYDDRGQFTGVAFVSLDSHKSALEACSTLNGMKMAIDRRLYVDRAFTRKQWVQKEEKERYTGLWRVLVKNVHWKVDDEMLFRRFSRFGKIFSYRVARSRRSNESLGYGYVVYLSRGAAERAIEELDGIKWYGRDVTVEEYVPFVEEPPKDTYGRRLYVRGKGMDRESLTNLFRIYGDVEEVDVYHKMFSEFGFVTFADKSMADKALVNASLIRKMLPGRELIVELAEPVPKEPEVVNFECQACFKTQDLGYRQSLGCDHQFCWECLNEYLETIIEAGIRPTTCPDGRCAQPLDGQVIRMFVRDSVYATYKNLVQSSARQNSNANLQKPQQTVATSDNTCRQIENRVQANRMYVGHRQPAG